MPWFHAPKGPIRKNRPFWDSWLLVLLLPGLSSTACERLKAPSMEVKVKRGKRRLDIMETVRMLNLVGRRP